MMNNGAKQQLLELAILLTLVAMKNADAFVMRRSRDPLFSYNIKAPSSSHVHKHQQLFPPQRQTWQGVHDTNVQEINSRKALVANVGLGNWIAGMSCFLAVNYFVGPWPAALSRIPRRVLTLWHAMSSTVFGGTILVSTIVECWVARSKNAPVLKFWFLTVPALDSFLVLPALAMSIISGVAQAAQDYVCLKTSPKHVVGTIHALLTFGMWWAFTDLTTQRSAKLDISKWCAEEEHGNSTEIPRVVHKRQWSNVVSCLFVGALYAIMALKPGYNP